MVLYGSTAVLVGFAGTYTVLRGAFPYNRRDNLADANWARNQAASGSVIKPATEATDNKSTDASKDALKESGMVVSEAPSAAQPSPNVQAPAIPSSNSGPVTATPSVTPAPTTVEPADVTPVPQPEPQPTPNPAPIVDKPIIPVASPNESTTDSIINVQIQR
jgi:hypothetical protein